MISIRRNIFLLTLLLSSISNMFYIFCLPLIVYDYSKSLVNMGITTIFEAVTALILFPFIGYTVDRFNLKKILIVSEIVQFITLLFFWWNIQYFGTYQIVYLVAILISGTSQIIRNSTFKLTPIIFRDLKKGNSQISLISTIGDFGGPVIATALIAVTGVDSLILFSSVFALVVTILYYVVFDFQAKDGFINNKINTVETKTGDVWRELISGIKYVKESKLLINLMIISAFSALADNGLVNILIYTMRSIYKFSNSSVSMVFMLASFATFLGSIYVNKLKIDEGKIYIMALLANNIGIVLLLIKLPFIIPLALITTSFFGIMFYIIQNTLIQRIVPANILGRVNSFFRVSTYSLRPFSIIILTFMSEKFGYYSSFILSSIFVGIVSLLVLKMKPFLSRLSEG
jgi:MFS transporter, DHA3 family, macrolide efflux protein